jgi:hypothetical protein
LLGSCSLVKHCSGTFQPGINKEIIRAVNSKARRFIHRFQQLTFYDYIESANTPGHSPRIGFSYGALSRACVGITKASNYNTHV